MDLGDEVAHWRPFKPEGGEEIDLSFLDAHKVSYLIEEADGKHQQYDFYVTYSFHCFAKEYEWQTEEDKQRLMYFAPRDARPFCYVRYEYARKHIRSIIDNLPSSLILHAGFGSYAAVEVVSEGGSSWYFVPFRVYRHKKKFRLHVTSAYPVGELPKKGRVRFQTIARNLRLGKKLPTPRGG